MTIIDEIKAEFQKRFEKCQSVSEDDRNALDVQDYYRGKYTAYSEAISFINMLPQEQEKERYSEDLEEVARAYSEQVTDGHNYRDLTCGFKAGAKWQKRQMLNDAVYMTKCNLSLGNHTEKVLAFGDRFPNGEKIRVIIIKEEE